MADYERYWNNEEFPSVTDRKKLIQIEDNVKNALHLLNTAMWDLDSVYLCSEKWEIAYHIYDAVESCDNALRVVFDKEAALMKNGGVNIVSANSGKPII